MSVVQLDLQKIEQLLNSATSSRQRKMYQALLDKARSQLVQSTETIAPQTTPETRTARAPEPSSGDVSSEKKAQTKTNQKTETKTKTKTTLKQKKATTKETTNEASTPTRQSTTPVTESTTQITQFESDGKTITEPLPEEQPKQQPDSETPIFQALGTILATPYLKGERLKVAIDAREYDLLCLRDYRRRAYMSLSSELEENGSKEMFLKLYPQATFEQSSAEPILSFSLVNFSRACEKLNNYPQGFVLSGIWQYIPNSESPVISIYRNLNQLGFFKRLNKSRKFSFAQPRHLTVVWNATIEPFKFNPQVQKSEQMPRYFVEVRAIFKDGLYVVEEMLREPTVEIPKFIKVSKKKQPSIS